MRRRWTGAATAEGALDAKTKEPIALAIGIAARIAFHAQPLNG